MFDWLIAHPIATAVLVIGGMLGCCELYRNATATLKSERIRDDEERK